MAKEGRSLILNVFRNFINSLKPRQFRGNLIGKDHLGNQYYEIPSDRKNKRPSRYYIPEKGDVSKFDEGVPSEWESWLRFRRTIPPTVEEIETNLLAMKSRIEKAEEIDRKFKQQKIDRGEEITTPSKEFPKYEEFEIYPGKKPGTKN